MAGQQPEPEPGPKPEPFRFGLPDWDWRVPFVTRTKPHKGEPKYERKVKASDNYPEEWRFDGPDETKVTDSRTKRHVIGPDDNVLVDHSLRNKAVKGVKGLTKLNLLGTLFDAGNFAYENRDKFDNVTEFLDQYGDDIVEGVQRLGEEAWKAIQDNDLSKIFELGINSVIPVSTVTRAADNVADWLGFDTNFTQDVAEFVHDATKDSPILTGASDAWHSAVDAFNDTFDLSGVDEWYTDNIAEPVSQLADEAGEAVGNLWHEFTSLFS